MTISGVEEEVNELEQSIFADKDIIELMKQATGFNCDKLTDQDALFILNRINKFNYIDPTPTKGVRFLDQNCFKCVFCQLTGAESTFAKKSELRQHNRDHFGLQFKCAHCEFEASDRASVLR